MVAVPISVYFPISNLDIIKSADHIIDIGPDGGIGGGKVVATGSPEQVATNPNSYTGQYLKKVLKKAKDEAKGK